jgi:hypothetical protein
MSLKNSHGQISQSLTAERVLGVSDQEDEVGQGAAMENSADCPCFPTSQTPSASRKSNKSQDLDGPDPTQPHIQPLSGDH